jgi:hypothetical protein
VCEKFLRHDLLKRASARLSAKNSLAVQFIFGAKISIVQVIFGDC